MAHMRVYVRTLEKKGGAKLCGKGGMAAIFTCGKASGRHPAHKQKRRLICFFKKSAAIIIVVRYKARRLKKAGQRMDVAYPVIVLHCTDHCIVIV